MDEPTKCTVTPDCPGTLVWGVEFKGWGATPVSTGLMVEFCEVCGESSGNRYWIGF